MNVIKPAVIVYVVDDDASVRKAFSRLLSSVGFGVEAYESAEEFLKAGPPVASHSCLVLDIYLGGMSGLDLHDALVQSGISIPTIFVTAYEDEAIRQRVLKTGGNLLIKPIEEKVLIDAVLRALLP